MDLSLLLIILLIGFSLFGVPIGISIIASSLIYILSAGGLPLIVLAQKVSSGVQSYLYVSIPLYILAGGIMEESGITDKLLDASKLLVGHIAGGLAQVNVVVSCIFAGVSGSALSDVASEGPVIIPAMKKAGFDAPFAVAITAASSLVGPIIPPSIPFVVYGSIASVSIGKMFLGGTIPGLIMGAYMMLMCWYIAKKRNYPKYPRARVSEMVKGVWTSLPALLMPATIILGIGFGFFTPTESAAVAVLYGLTYSLIMRTFRLKKFVLQLYKSAITTTAVMLVVGGASILGYLLTIEGAPKRIVAFLTGLSSNPYIVMVAIGLFLMIVGMFMSVNAALVILTPILLPVAHAFNYDLVWFGVLVSIWLCVGLLTPPVCSCLQLACRIGKVSLMDGFKATLPFIIAMVVMSLLITFFPSIITFLPNLWMP